MASAEPQLAPATSSLNDVWSSTVGSDSAAAEPSSELEAADVTSFVASVECHVQDWGQLFTQVPSEHERRKEALGGALKIKAAAKRFEKVTTALTGDEAETDGAGAKGGDDEAKSTLSHSLTECQAILHEVVLGLLEVCFPIHESINNSDFKDSAARDAAMERMRVVAEVTEALGRLFGKGKISPTALASVNGQEDPLAPEVLKMLEKSMNKQKQKDKKNKKKGQQGSESADTSAANLKAARAVWDQTEGRCSGLLGQEVWEGLCWHRGIFLFGYIRCLLDEKQEGEDGKSGEAAASEADASTQPVSRALFLEAMWSFRRMLTAQGPVHSDVEDPALWQVASDGPHKDESARMFYHGIYTSMHLRSLKHLAELSYWLWKHGGRSALDARLAALLNRKFVHVVKHIMPHAGWTADAEHERILEMESTTLSSSDFSSGLDENLVVRNLSKIALVPEVAKNKAGKAGGYSAGQAATAPAGPPAGSAVSSTAPVQAAAAPSSDEG